MTLAPSSYEPAEPEVVVEVVSVAAAVVAVGTVVAMLDHFEGMVESRVEMELMRSIHYCHNVIGQFRYRQLSAETALHR